MTTTIDIVQVEAVGVDTPPAIADNEWWISGDAASTPTGAWSSWTPPFIAYGDTTTNAWSHSPLSTRSIYWDKTNKTLWVHPAGGYLEAPSEALSTGVVYVTDTNHTVGDGESIIIVTGTAVGDITITLPDIDALPFTKLVSVILTGNTGGGSVIVTAAAGEQVAETPSYTFQYDFGSLQLVSTSTLGSNVWAPLYHEGHGYSLTQHRGGVTSSDLDTSAAVLTDTVNEHTATAGVTVDGVLLKDSQVSTDVINEKTATAGVTVDGMLIKDGATSSDNITDASGLAEANVSDALDTLLALTQNYPPKWLAGATYYPCHAATPSVTTNTSGGSGTIGYTPFYCAIAKTIQHIYVEVTTATAGGSCRLAIYEDDGAGNPGNLLQESGAITATSTGVKVFTLSGGGTAVPQGQYWVAVRSSANAIQYKGLAQSSCTAFLGASASPGSLANIRTQRTEAGAYGAFPATANAATFSGANVVLAVVET